MRLFFASSAALLATAVAAPALADLAPPAGYEEQCTLQKQSSPTTECYSCNAFYGNADHCPKSLADYKFTQKCRARGASVWSEVWCRAKSASAPAVPPTVLAQLGDAQSKLGPASSAIVLPSAPSAAPSGAAASSAAPATSAAPAASSQATAPASSSKPAQGDVSAPKDPPPAPPPKKSCALAAPGSLGSSLGVASVLLVLGALRRRRSPARA